MTGKYFVHHQGQQWGPWSRDEIVSRLESGKLNVMDYVFDDSRKDWVPLLDFAPVRECLDLEKKASGQAGELSFVGPSRERRKFARISYSTSILIHNNRHVWKGTARELGAGGASILVGSGEIKVGENLFLHFQAGGGLPPFSAICNIVSRQEMGHSIFRYHLKFTSVAQTVQGAIQSFAERTAEEGL